MRVIACIMVCVLLLASMSHRTLAASAYVGSEIAVPPTSNGIDDFSVPEDATPTTIDLNTIFEDPDELGALTFSIQSNTNPDLVSTNIAAGELSLTYTTNEWGSATVIVSM